MSFKLRPVRPHFLQWLGPDEQLTAPLDHLTGRRQGAVLWFTGLSGAGKSTLADALRDALESAGLPCARLDGDRLRAGLCADLGFSHADRVENVRRAGEVAALMAEEGVWVLASLISPSREARQQVRQRIALTPFWEVYCNSPLSVCEARDTKGLYRRARAGHLPDFTGVASPYDVPVHPDLEVDTASTDVPQCVEQLVQALLERGMLAVSSTSQSQGPGAGYERGRA